LCAAFFLPISANWQTLANFHLKTSPILQKPYLVRDFLYSKNFKKSAKPMGKHWRTNSATLSNFA